MTRNVGRGFSPAEHAGSKDPAYVPLSQAPTLTSPALMTGAVVPLTPRMNLEGGWFQLQALNVNVGVLFVLAISSLGVYSITLAGWASNNKFALLGGVRASSQMISYEVALGLSLVFGVMRVVNVAHGEFFMLGAMLGGCLEYAALVVGYPAYGDARRAPIRVAWQGRTVHTGTLEEQKFPDAHFDVVSLFEVIEHLREPLPLLAECGRILRPGGVLIRALEPLEGLPLMHRRRSKAPWRKGKPPVPDHELYTPPEVAIRTPRPTRRRCPTCRASGKSTRTVLPPAGRPASSPPTWKKP